MTWHCVAAARASFAVADADVRGDGREARQDPRHETGKRRGADEHTHDHRTTPHGKLARLRHQGAVPTTATIHCNKLLTFLSRCGSWRSARNGRSRLLRSKTRSSTTCKGGWKRSKPNARWCNNETKPRQRHLQNECGFTILTPG